MIITFIRHGHPNYKHDCLTELGHNQAIAAAERLANEGIEKLYASPLGRAQQTAAHIAEKIGLPIETLPFMREIGWGAADGSETPFGGHPWHVAWDMAARGQSLISPTFAEEAPAAETAPAAPENTPAASQGVPLEAPAAEEEAVPAAAPAETAAEDPAEEAESYKKSHRLCP